MSIDTLINRKSIKMMLFEENTRWEVLLLSSLGNKICHTAVWHFRLDYKPNEGKDFVPFTTVFSTYKSAEIMSVLDTYLCKLINEMFHKERSS